MYWYIDTFEKAHSEPIFKELKILKIHDIYKLTTLKFVYESLNKLNPSQFHNYYNYSEGEINTAATRDNNLDTPMVRTTIYGLKALKYSGCTLWNDQPIDSRNAISKKVFTKTVKLHMINSYKTDE